MYTPGEVNCALIDTLSVLMFENGYTIKPWEDENERDNFKCYEFEDSDLYVYKNTAIAEVVRHSDVEYEIKQYI